MGIRCPSCGEDNRDGALFCTMCKAVLTRTRAASAAPPPIRHSHSHSHSHSPSPSPSHSHSHSLVFLDPPHAATLDLAAVASALGLQVADARMRVGLPIPAPVALTEDRASSAALAAALGAAGLRVSLPTANELLAQPMEEDVVAFALDDEAFTFRTSEGDAHFAWASLRAAFLVMQSSFAVRRNRAEQMALEKAREVIDEGYRDLAWGYKRGARHAGQRALQLLDFAQGGVTEAITIALHLVADAGAGERVHLVLTQGSLRYEGLGPHRGSGGQESWDALLARVRAGAPHVTLDRRAERAAPRFPALPGLAKVFGGKMPSAGWLHGAYLAWSASR